MFCRIKSIVFKIKIVTCLRLCRSFENLNKYMANILKTIGDDNLMVSFDFTSLPQTAISMALHPPTVWEQVVDDIYSILKCTHLETSSITSTIFIKTFTM